MNDKRSKWVGTIIFICYILLLLKLIVFKVPISMMQHIAEDWSPELVQMKFTNANFVPFKTISMYIKYWGSNGMRPFENLVGNIAVFVPMGMLFPWVKKSAQNVLICLSYGLLFVVGIEVFQMLSLLGSFDVDDVILNCCGILIGYVIYLTATTIMRKCVIKKNEED